MRISIALSTLLVGSTAFAQEQYDPAQAQVAQAIASQTVPQVAAPQAFAPQQAAAPQIVAPPSAAPLGAAAIAMMPAAQRLRLVGVILSSSQALLWDENEGEYALRRVGEDIDGGHLVALSAQLAIVERATQNGNIREALQLSAPPTYKNASQRVKRGPAMVIGGAFPTASDIAASQPQANYPAAMPAQQLQPQQPMPMQPQQPAAPVVISRAELDHELADFSALGSQIALEQTARGDFQLVGVQPGSFVERIGLRAGDVILSVDGRPIHKLEDASAAYAWLRVADQFRIDVQRQGFTRPIALHYSIAHETAAAAPTAPMATN